MRREIVAFGLIERLCLCLAEFVLIEVVAQQSRQHIPGFVGCVVGPCVEAVVRQTAAFASDASVVGIDTECGYECIGIKTAAADVQAAVDGIVRDCHIADAKSCYLCRAVDIETVCGRSRADAHVAIAPQYADSVQVI